MTVSTTKFLEEYGAPRPAETQLRGLDLYRLSPEGRALTDRARGEFDEGSVEGRDKETERAELPLADFILYTISIGVTGLRFEGKMEPETLPEKSSECCPVAPPAERSNRQISIDTK